MTDEQRERFSRHLILPEMGEEGQERLLASRVLVIGVGGLGSPISLYLTAAGVGCLGLADHDVVTLSNLQRQVLHGDANVGQPKVESAREKLMRINHDLRLQCHQQRVTDENVEELISQYDFVVEATDNVASRYRVNDACVRLGQPYVMGGVSHYGGQVMTWMPGCTTYRDIFPDGEDRHQPLPVFSPLVGMLGTIMAAEVVKCVAGVGKPLTNRLLVFDALTMNFNTLNI